MIEVSAGIVRREDGRILVCRRGPGRRNAHLWEFPGGKREAGESAEACLERELLEELSLPVRDVRPVFEDTAQGIRFTFLAARTDAVPAVTEHEDLRFVRPREMLSLPFCPADVPAAQALALNAPPVRDVFWDYDGTLADSYPHLTRCLCAAAASLGAALDQPRAMDLMKVSLSHALRTLSGESGVPADALAEAFARLDRAVPPEEIPLTPGIPAALRRLAAAGRRHFLVTHNSRRALASLERADVLSLFTDIVTKEDGFPRKPAPDALLHLMEAHGAAPETSVMVGDRPLDVEAGHAAGMIGCLLDPEGRFPAGTAELVCADAAALPELICPAAIL